MRADVRMCVYMHTCVNMYKCGGTEEGEHSVFLCRNATEAPTAFKGMVVVARGLSTALVQKCNVLLAGPRMTRDGLTLVGSESDALNKTTS